MSHNQTEAEKKIPYVGFYEREFYVLSNFSAFKVHWKGIDFDTAEAVYHWEKFEGRPEIQQLIIEARSAHDAYKIAFSHKGKERKNWKVLKVPTMLKILRAKALQHEYVRRKLLETDELLLVEDSWRDAFWGWGPDQNGANMLGWLWVIVRNELSVD